MNWRRPTSIQAPELGEELYSWGDAHCSTSFSCLLSETGMVQLHHLRHSGHEQGNGSEAKHRASVPSHPSSGASYSHGLTSLL